jgi:hypothetical protein
LHDILWDHPQIFLPSDKELHFFDNPDIYSKGENWYSDQFTGNEKVKGEITPAYMSYEATPERIFRTIGKNVKLIFMFREPVERAFSEYQHNYRRGLLDEATFQEALEKEKKWSGPEPFDKRHFSFIQRGNYADQVEGFLKFFPKEQMLFIRFKEDLIEQKNLCISTVLEFLNVEPFELNINKKSNASFIPKSRMVTKMMEKDNSLRSLARLVVGNPVVRKKIRFILNKANSKSEKSANLTLDERRLLQEKYYPNEQKRLELLIRKPLPSFDLTNEIKAHA